MHRSWRFFLVAVAWALCASAWSQDGPDYELTDDTVEIESGTTMFYLVRDFYPNHRNDWLRVARDLAKANPQAFRNGDPGALIVGKTIRLIDYGDGIAEVADETDTTAAAQPDAIATEPAETTPPATSEDTEVTAPAAATPAAKPAGALTGIAQITRIRGTPVAIDLNNRQRELRANATIYRGDTLLTDETQRLSLLMNDGAVLRVRPGTRLTFEKYRIDATAADDNGSILTLVRGGMRLTTGDLAELRNGVLINTAVATLASTGGDVAVRLCDDVECIVPGSSAAVIGGLYSGVALGELTVSNNTGPVTAVRGEVLRVRTADLAPHLAAQTLGVVFNQNELTTLDLQSDEPLGFLAWFRQRFFSFSDAPHAATDDAE
ncbi:MAG: hypothetical protein AB8G16_07300 [Gammaproteobacteria bacterium]